eukprot:5749272-Amphidinium_carterae.5
MGAFGHGARMVKIGLCASMRKHTSTLLRTIASGIRWRFRLGRKISFTSMRAPRAKRGGNGRQSSLCGAQRRGISFSRRRHPWSGSPLRTTCQSLAAAASDARRDTGGSCGQFTEGTRFLVPMAGFPHSPERNFGAPQAALASTRPLEVIAGIPGAGSS